MNRALLSLGLANNHIGDRGAQKLAEVIHSIHVNFLQCYTNLMNQLLGIDKLPLCVVSTRFLCIFQTLSRFSLTHEEVVERRKLLSENRDRQKSVSVSLHVAACCLLPLLLLLSSFFSIMWTRMYRINTAAVSQ